MSQRLRDLQLRQQDLADSLGLARKQVQRYLAGPERVPVWFLARYIEEVPTNPRWLLLGRGKPEAGTEGLRAEHATALEIRDMLAGLLFEIEERYDLPPTPPDASREERDRRALAALRRDQEGKGPDD